ncbi:alpha-amylase A-like [Leptopilina heterotoma]|uniref:alpha-amylase A-like n=1 Tax=Leptopilina heterotoma TaxID=63436 RepID=UPI001CA8226C|nr:alpha-amylase A-like [Leptopilina heterotoma]XP_043481346.1 alpha-amylase A-like [Leptopilina heterotoma]XP_043481347.1 alpha-amylase A-like [Leptopilina heterotoma]
MNNYSFCLVVFLLFLNIIRGQKNPHYKDDRTTMVHLFEWKFDDIAKECERFLGPAGYAAVQVSPINENMILAKRPWFERYQPISYKIETRSGNEAGFKDMVRRCNAVGVRIFVDVVVNHMTTDQSPAIGTGGTRARPHRREYPAVPFGPQDFHQQCTIANYKNATEVRVCELSGLHDLNQTRENVREAIVHFLDRCVDAGVAGFRFDAAKHMYPNDLKVIYGRIKNLNTKHGYPAKSRPFIYQEVIDLGGEAVSKFEYNGFGTVIEFAFGIILGMMFRNEKELKDLENWGQPGAWGLLPSSDAVVMIDNHDNQRGHGAGGASILNYKLPRQYKMAQAFMLAHPYGDARVMSSFEFTDPNAGPPADENGNLESPIINVTGNACDNGWVCEHRWPEIRNMVKFRNIAKGAKLTKWWSNGKDQIAFARERRGFIVFNNQKNLDLKQRLNTGLPAGRYCDIISGNMNFGNRCSVKTIDVDKKGFADFEIPHMAHNGVIAIHIKARL